MKKERRMIWVSLEEGLQRIRLENAFWDGQLALVETMLKNGMPKDDIMKYASWSSEDVEWAAQEVINIPFELEELDGREQ